MAEDRTSAMTEGSRSGDGAPGPTGRGRSARVAVRMAIATALLSMTWSSPADATVDCRPLIAEHVSWIKAKVTAHRVGAKMAAVKIRDSRPERYPWGHGSYADGGFGLHGDDLVGRFLVAFSDRMKPGAHGFDPGRRDIQDVTVFADGRVQVLLRSWGDTALWLEQVTCYPEGFITGVKREGNGVSMVSLLLRKEVIVPR